MNAIVPFVVGKPVTGEYFINRVEELDQMVNLLSAVSSGASSNVALIGLRRTGKTSLFENVRLRIVNTEHVVPVLVNCFGISTKARFSKMFVQEVARAYILKTEDYLRKDRLVSFLKKGLRRSQNRFRMWIYQSRNLRSSQLSLESQKLMKMNL
jgi:Cdc6-like AAA superfamily ATPase